MEHLYTEKVRKAVTATAKTRELSSSRAAALEVAAEKACGWMKGLNAQKLTMPVDELHAAMCSPQVGTVKLQLDASGIIMLLTKEGWLEQDAGGIGRVALTLKGRTMPTPDELARPTLDELAGSTDTFDEQVKFKALKWIQSREIAGNLPKTSLAMSHSLKQICKLPVKVPATQILCVLAKAGLLVWGRVTAEIMRAVDAAAPEQCSGCDNTAVPLCGRIDFTAPGCRFCAACWEKYDANVKSNAPNHRPLPTVALLQSALLRKHETPEQIVGVM
jgi:hypothetical protein